MLHRTLPYPAALRSLFLLALAALLSFGIHVAPPHAAHAATTTLTRTGDALTLTNGVVTVRYDLGAGLIDLDGAGAVAVRHGYAAVRLVTDNGRRTLSSFETTSRSHAPQPVADALGRGLRLTVTGESPALDATLVQEITIYDTHPFALLRVEAGRLPRAGGRAIATDQIEVLAANSLTDPPGSTSMPGGDVRLYRVPFDNDGDLAVPLAAGEAGTLSFWLTALFDATDGHGLVAGATETGVWKSAAWWDGTTGALSLFSGARSPKDRAGHAVRRADRVASAEFLVGGYPDHHDGLADLMKVLALREPPLPAPALPPPLGWNPWYQYGATADEHIVRDVTDFLAENWASFGYRYVNLDAGWNVMDGNWQASPERFPSGMAALTSYIHEHGLLAGSYFIPFAVNARLLDQPIPGTPYTFGDAVLRDAAGTPVPADLLALDVVLDGTHPGTLTYLHDTAAAIAAEGFDFVKLDFLQIGTQEGQHWDASATAMEAFHRGMAAVRDGFASAGREIYLSAAISPLYVHPYVHARRVGTDVNFGTAREAQNVALSWFTELLYVRNDPDNVVVREGWYPDEGEGMARLHATMDVLGGSLFILGDDPRLLSAERSALLTDPDILALAHEGVATRPLDVGETPAPVWAGRLRDGSVVVGIFNWGDTPVRRDVSFARLGLDPVRRYTVRDLWNPEAGGATTGSYAIGLPPRSAALLRVEP